MWLGLWCGVWLVSAIGVGLKPANAIASFSQNLSFLTVSSLDRNSSFSTSFQMAQIPDPGRTRTPDPNRDRLIQPGPPPTPLPPTPPLLPTPTLPPEPTPEQPAIKIPVSRIEVTGSTILTQNDLTPILQPVEGREATLEELRQVADAITQLYLDRGYITSRAILVDQTIQNGVVKIRVIEGSLEEIQVQGNQNMKPAYIRSRIGLGAHPPLNRDALEDQLRLLKLDPLFTNVEASLRPGTQLGKSLLIVRVTEAKSLSGLITVDNYSPPSVGSVRLGGALSYRNLTGYGDELAVSIFHTTNSGADNLDLFYRIPVNPLNGTLQFRFAPNWNRITQAPFDVLDIQGRSQLYQFSFRQPLIRNPRQELALTLGFAAQNGQTFLFNDILFPPLGLALSQMAIAALAFSPLGRTM
ncbi:ShlB/FhaC/HecB family hemolysin secretion/activation protein [Leptodesmis sp.]|uniref:ShlB/FhaC/HecB family hemolysin secretion/activation protein n=1 Tax=Leptodesmis sp. TaxID=3100501 RepID=UPI0040534DC5